MQSGHIIYKTNDLHKTVEKFRKMGFEVEYGKIKNPKNALIYFQHGPYFEILEKTGFPKFLKIIFSIIGKQDFVKRVDYWDNANEGLVGFCIEGTPKELEHVKKVYKNKGQSLNPKRLDTHNRLLEYSVFFPYDNDLPFFMTHFSINPRPKRNNHPNGVTTISKILYPLSEDKATIIRNLLDINDPLQFSELDSKIEISFSKSNINID